MGRYDDRLTVGAGGNKTCANLYLGTSGGNVDLGNNTSYNKQEMYIGTSSGNKRVTRVREDYTIYGDKYIYGPLTQTSTSQHFCNCTVVSSKNRLYCGFKGWVYVNSGISSDQVICQHTVGSTCYWKLLITSSGQLKFQDRYNSGTIQTGYGKTMSFNAWHYVEVLSGYLYNGGANNYMYNQIDSNGWATFKSTTTGSTTKSLGGLYYQWSGKVQIGTGSVAFKGTIQIWGANGSSKYNNSFNVQDRTAGSSFGSLGIGNITISGSNTVSQYTSSGTNWV